MTATSVLYQAFCALLTLFWFVALIAYWLGWYVPSQTVIASGALIALALGSRATK